MNMVRSPVQRAFQSQLATLDSRERRIVLADLDAGDSAPSSMLARRLGCSVCEVISARDAARRLLESALGSLGEPLPWHQLLDALGVEVRLRRLTHEEAEAEWCSVVERDAAAACGGLSTPAPFPRTHGWRARAGRALAL